MGISGRESAIAKLLDIDATLVRQLLRWRWPIVVLTGALFIAWEAIDHRPTTMLTDPQLIQEALVFGILSPLVTGVALGLLARTGVQRSQAHQRLDLEHEWSRELARVDTWEELTALIVRLPSRMIPVIGTTLFVPSPEGDQWNTAAEWWDPDKPFPPGRTNRVPDTTPGAIPVQA